MTDPAKPTLVEKMAQKAHDARRQADGTYFGKEVTALSAWERMPPYVREFEVAAMRAALAVVMAEMRKPTIAMQRAGESAVIRGAEPGEGGGCGLCHLDGWRAMLAQFEAGNP